MIGKLVDSSPTLLKKLKPDIGVHYAGMREAAFKSGPLEKTTCQLIMLGAFVAAGYEMAFRNHTKWLKESGIPKAAVEQAVLVTLGSTTDVNQIGPALSWIEDVYGPSEQI